MQAVVSAAGPLLRAGRWLGLAPVSVCASPTGPSTLRASLRWRLYSWALTALVTAPMALALHSTVPAQTRPGSAGFRADIFVYVVTCLNDAAAVSLLVLANVKARAAAAAFNQLVRCEVAAAALASGRGVARRTGLHVGAVLLGLVGYMVGVAAYIQAGGGPPMHREDQDGVPMLRLAHLTGLPMLLFYCLMFADQLFLLGLQVRSLNSRLRAMLLGPGGRGHGRGRGPGIGPSWAAPRQPCALVGLAPAKVGAAWPRRGWFSDGAALNLATPGDACDADVLALRSIYSQLRHALTLLTSAHAQELLVVLLVVFTACTTCMYIHLTSREGAPLALAWSGFVLAGLVVVFSAGELVKRESRSTTSLTQRILIYQDLSPAVRREMRGFSQLLLHQGLQVSVYGCLPVDLSMLRGMLGSITTYLIMVIQLSPSSEQGDHGGQDARNATVAA